MSGLTIFSSTIREMIHKLKMDQKNVLAKEGALLKEQEEIHLLMKDTEDQWRQVNEVYEANRTSHQLSDTEVGELVMKRSNLQCRLENLAQKAEGVAYQMVINQNRKDTDLSAIQKKMDMLDHYLAHLSKIGRSVQSESPTGVTDTTNHSAIGTLERLPDEVVCFFYTGLPRVGVLKTGSFYLEDGEALKPLTYPGAFSVLNCSSLPTKKKALEENKPQSYGASDWSVWAKEEGWTCRPREIPPTL